MEVTGTNMAAVAAFMSAIAAALTVWATFRGPVAAAEQAEKLRSQNAELSEIRRLRLWIFGTLMQERANLVSPASVQALNLIDVVYSDVPEVREAWADLYHWFNQKEPLHEQLTSDKTRELLRRMALSLSLSNHLKRDDFSRVYYPNALAEADYVKVLTQINAKQQLEAVLKPPATANSAPMFSGPTGPAPPVLTPAHSPVGPR